MVDSFKFRVDSQQAQPYDCLSPGGTVMDSIILMAPPNSKLETRSSELLLLTTGNWPLTTALP